MAVCHLAHAKYDTKKCKCRSEQINTHIKVHGFDQRKTHRTLDVLCLCESMFFFKWPLHFCETIDFIHICILVHNEMQTCCESYLEILILNAKALSQVSEHLRTVLFEFKLSWKSLPEE